LHHKIEVKLQCLLLEKIVVLYQDIILKEVFKLKTLKVFREIMVIVKSDASKLMLIINIYIVRHYMLKII
jgi:hypothetical protein